jgi:hypothetical protein
MMTDENGRLLGNYRIMTDKHDHLVRIYRTVWWRKTRQMIIGRVVHRSDRLLGQIDGVSVCDEELRGDIEAEIECIRNDAMTPPSGKMPPRQRAIWDAAIDFFFDPVKLAHSIIIDEAVRGLKPGVTQKQALRVIMRSYLNARHREIEGTTEYEHRVWAKLYPISNDLMREYPRRHGHFPPLAHRCSWEHAEDIRARILHDMPNDRIVGNIRMSTIKEYFDQFCDECRQITSQEYVRLLHGQSLSDDAAGLPPEVKEAVLRQLEEAIEQLDEPKRSVVRASLQPDGGAEYRRREGMQNAEFGRLLRLAKRELRGRLDPEK